MVFSKTLTPAPRVYFNMSWSSVCPRLRVGDANSEHMLLDEVGLATEPPTLFVHNQLWRPILEVPRHLSTFIMAGGEAVDVRTNSLGYDGGDDFGGELSIVETNGVLGGVMAFWEASYDCLEVAFNLTPRAYFGLIWLGLQACGHRPGVAGMGQFVADKESFYGVNSERVPLDEAGLATELPTLFYPSQLWNDMPSCVLFLCMSGRRQARMT